MLQWREKKRSDGTDDGSYILFLNDFWVVLHNLTTGNKDVCFV